MTTRHHQLAPCFRPVMHGELVAKITSARERIAAERAAADKLAADTTREVEAMILGHRPVSA